MRRVMLLAVSILMVVSMAAFPALAHDRDRDCWDEDDFFWRNNCNDEVEVVYVVDYGFWYPWYYSFPYYYGYSDCGFDWDGPVTPEDCWD